MGRESKTRPGRPFLDIRIGALRITLESRPTKLLAILTTVTIGAGSWLAAGGTGLPTR